MEIIKDTLILAIYDFDETPITYRGNQVKIRILNKI